MTGLKEKLREKFVYVDDIANVLEIGYNCKKNVFLYGRGGHAKSEIAEEFLKHVDSDGSNSFIQACGEGLTEEKLFGGMDLAKFKKTGEIEYLVANSFMNKKYVVFEELLDSRMSVLLSLKDIITSGIFRQGSQQFKIKTEFIVCLTNRTKQEVSEDDSIKALLERFPIEYKVEWNEYNEGSYSNMFQKVLKEPMNEIASICHAVCESGNFVSPRTAIHMAQVYNTTKNIDDLKYFGVTGDVIDVINEKKKAIMIEKDLDQKVSDFAALHQMFAEATTIPELKRLKEEVTLMYSRVTVVSYPDGPVFSKFNALRDNITSLLVSYRDRVIGIAENC